MKRRYAYSKNSKEYFWRQKSIKNNFFEGEVCYLKFVNIQNPLVVKNELSTITIRDNGYEWLELYPNNGNYVITIMFDNKHNLLEWYFDISKKVSMEDGIPYEDDLYLDYVIYPDGRDVVVDGDELQEACDNKDVSNEDVLFAYEVLKKLKNKFFNNLDELKSFTYSLYNEFLNIKNEQEITVMVNCNTETLIQKLENKGFEKVDEYFVDDEYYVKNDIDLNDNPLNVLKECVLVRNINDKKFYLTYKQKEYDENENIINQGKLNLKVESLSLAAAFIENIGYKKLIKVYDQILVYKLDDIELAIEYVNDKYLMIEFEENDTYNTLDKMKNALNSLDLDIDNSNYFVKKAKIIFEDIYKGD